MIVVYLPITVTDAHCT